MVPEPQAQITEGTISTNGKHLGKHATNGLILIFYVSSSLYLELKKKNDHNFACACFQQLLDVLKHINLWRLCVIKVPSCVKIRDYAH